MNSLLAWAVTFNYVSIWACISTLVLGPPGLRCGPACVPLLPDHKHWPRRHPPALSLGKHCPRCLFMNTSVLEWSPALCKLSRWQPGLSSLQSLGQTPPLSLLTRSHTLRHLSLGAPILSSLLGWGHLPSHIVFLAPTSPHMVREHAGCTVSICGMRGCAHCRLISVLWACVDFLKLLCQWGLPPCKHIQSDPEENQAASLLTSPINPALIFIIFGVGLFGNLSVENLGVHCCEANFLHSFILSVVWPYKAEGQPEGKLWKNLSLSLVVGIKQLL